MHNNTVEKIMKKRISNHHRKNLELTYQSYLFFGTMYLAATYTTLVIGTIAFIQVPIGEGAIIMIAAISLAMAFFIMGLGYIRWLDKIEEALGVKETVTKYLESKKKASAK